MMTIPREFHFGELLDGRSKLTFLYEIEPRVYTYPHSSKTTRLRRGVFICECGNLTESFIGDVKRGKSLCCGCAGKKALSQRMTTHGYSKHYLYGTWESMHTRCSCEKSIKYHNYGGRGITVCERWSGEDGFYNFITDMGDRPEGTTLDRIDSNKNYSPENCRWIDLTNQGYNKRLSSLNTSGAVGVSYDKMHNKWLATIGYRNKQYHLGRFELFEDAVEVRRKAEVEIYGYNNNYWKGEQT